VTVQCICDGARYLTSQENAERTPFLTNSACPVHAAPTGEETAVKRAEAAYQAAWDDWAATVNAETGEHDKGLWRVMNDALDQVEAAKRDAIEDAFTRGYQRCKDEAIAAIRDLAPQRGELQREFIESAVFPLRDVLAVIRSLSPEGGEQ